MVTKLKNRFFYGWVMVAVAALGVFFSGPGQTYSNSTFIDEFIRDFGWSRTQISSIYSMSTFAAGMIMIFVGRFIDRFGQRKMMVIVGSLLSMALLFNSTINSITTLAIGFFMIRLLGQGSMSLIPNTLIAQWFIKKRGIAFSLMSLGAFISSASFPIINTWLIQTWTWQVAWRFWAVLLLVIFVPIAAIFVRNKPEDMGLVPDGKKPISESLDFQSISIEPAQYDWTLSEAMRTRAFWLILICVGIPSMVNTGITFHIFSIFNSQGLSSEMAAMILSMMAIVGIPMSFISGYILDRIPSQYALMMIFAIEIFLLSFLTIMTANHLAIVFGFFWGIANGLERIGLKTIWPNYYGRRYIGSINGVSSMIMVAGSSLGPLPFGLGFDLFGNYEMVLTIMLIFPIIGLISAYFAKKPSKKDV